MEHQQLYRWRSRIRHPIRSARRLVKRYLPAWDVALGRATSSYSQTGEDRVLAALIGDLRDGFYVDVGSHHPYRISNTALFYRLGWSGIDIDPAPGTCQRFQRQRRRSIALELAVGTQPGAAKFFEFSESAVSTISQEWAEMQEARFGRPLANHIEVEVRPLAAILDQYLPEGREIDLLTVDVEGSDLDVLRSNDWGRFRPRFLMVEAFDFVDLDKVGNSVVWQFLTDKGYRAVAATPTTVVFMRDDVGWTRL